MTLAPPRRSRRLAERACVAAVISVVAMLSPRAATANPGMTWTDTKARLEANPAVVKGSVGQDDGAGALPAAGRAEVRAGSLTWVLSAPLGPGGVVTSETFRAESGAAPIANIPEVRALIGAVYGAAAVKDFSNARLLASVPVYGSPVALHFYQAPGSPLAFELDTRQLTVYAAADLGGAMDRAGRCSRAPGCAP